jgi:hypothetical protein
MKKALFVLLSLVLPLAWSQPAFANKIYTIHNKTDYPIIVTFSTQGCNPYSYSNNILPKSTRTIDTPCGTAGIEVVMVGGTMQHPTRHGSCWANVKYVVAFNFNLMPASAAQGYCTVNTIAPGL